VRTGTMWKYCQELSQAGEIVTGGRTVTAGDLAKGFLRGTNGCDRSSADPSPLEARNVCSALNDRTVQTLQEGFELANDTDFGLTGGFFGSHQEAEQYLRQIQQEWRT